MASTTATKADLVSRSRCAESARIQRCQLGWSSLGDSVCALPLFVNSLLLILASSTRHLPMCDDHQETIVLRDGVYHPGLRDGVCHPGQQGRSVYLHNVLMPFLIKKCFQQILLSGVFDLWP